MNKDRINRILSETSRASKDRYEQEYFHFHQYRYRYILGKITQLRIAKHARVLDIGCYPLHLFNALQQLDYRVFGISSLHEPIKKPNIIVINLEKDKLPFTNNFFDLILFSETMEHLVANPLIYLREFKRVLRNGGTLLITTPNAAGLHKLVPILLGRSTYFPLEELFVTKLDDGSLYQRHNREYTRAELAFILSLAGFAIKQATYFNAYRSYQHKNSTGKPLKQLIRLFTFWLTTLYPKWRDTLYIEAIS